MADKRGKELSLVLTERAITAAKDYLEGFVKESEEELDTDESLSWEDSDSLTENEECGD